LGRSGPTVMTVGHCTFSGNQALGGAGGTGPDGLGSVARGGAIVNESFATLTMTHSTASENLARGGAGGPGRPGGNAFGGGIMNFTDQAGHTALFVSHSTISGNQSIGGDAGTGADGGTGSGGGI